MTPYLSSKAPVHDPWACAPQRETPRFSMAQSYLYMYLAICEVRPNASVNRMALTPAKCHAESSALARDIMRRLT
jgi:hypothetical protein